MEWTEAVIRSAQTGQVTYLPREHWCSDRHGAAMCIGCISPYHPWMHKV